MVKHKSWKLFLLLCEIILGISASTHWIVTENGRIQSYLDSPFYMRRPYDLLAFLDQDVRRNNIDVLYQNLVARKFHIDEKWSGLEGATDIESRLYSYDSDCLKAGKLLSEIDLYTSIAVDGTDRDGIELSDFLTEDLPPDASVVPECHKIVKLDFSMFTFEHLTAMASRPNLTMSPEHALVQWLKAINGISVASFGQQVAVGLSKNDSSWLHYNLGAIYWRIRGDAFRAIECGRRAVYFAPREYRDIPLLNLASIFHQARYPGEAAIILHAAVDHAPYQPVNHFALGNVYAILADYNRSIACYDNCLKLRPSLNQASTSKHAVLCHRKLETGLLELHEALQGILTELHDYHTQREQWLKLQERLIKEQAPLEAKLLSIPPEAFSAVLTNRGQTCTERGEDSKLSCAVNSDSQVLANNLQMDITLSLQMLLKNVETQAQKISEQMAKNSKLLGSGSSIKTPDKPSKLKTDDKKDEDNYLSKSHYSEEDKVVEQDGYTHVKPVDQPKYPPSMILPWENVAFDLPNWPPKELCVKWRNINVNKLKKVEVFLPPENKGFHVSAILSTYIDLPLDVEHSLPWYPPLCTIDANLENQIDSTYFQPLLIKQSTNANSGFVDVSLKNHLMQYVNNGISVEAEIGQRILSAMQKKVGPEWLLATLSSVYWRVRSNKRNALDCLKVALTKVPKEYRDVPLVSLASLMYELGFVDEALRTAGEAFTINKIEPATNFLLAILHDAKENSFGAIYHMKQTLRVDPGYRGGDADLLLRAWACNNKLVSLRNSDSQSGEEMCSERDRSVSGEGVLCSANGDQCKTAAIQCYRAERVVEDGDLMTFESVPLSNILSGSNENCNDQKKGLRSLYSSLLAAYSKNDEAEGSGNAEPDQSQLENIGEVYKKAIHMRMALEEERQERIASTNSMGDFYVSLSDDPTPKVLLHVYDKSGTYQLSPATCKDIKDADWISFTSMWWHSVAARNIDIGPLLKPLPDKLSEPLVPFCDKFSPTTPQVAEHIPIIPANKYMHAPEPRLSDWLALMTGDPKSSIKDLGTRIAMALKENTTSWMLATAAAIYWRVLGNTAQAITCLKHALHVAPETDKDIPMINLANVLQRIGFLGDALEVAKMALEIHPDYVVNQFTIGNIHTALGDFEKAISFYRTSLILDPNFEAARNRLQAILCTLLFDETGSLRDTADIYTQNN